MSKKICYNFDYFLRKHEQEEQEHHCLGARAVSCRSLKDEELMVLLEEIIVETRKDVVGNFFSPKVGYIIKIGKEVVGIPTPPKVA